MNAIRNQSQTNTEKKTSDNDDEVKDQNIQTQTEKGKSLILYRCKIYE